VLVPKWLPAGFSSSGGGYVHPPGGLTLGNQAATGGISSPGSPQHSNPTLFTLTYYGYHDPVEMIWLTASRYSFGISGPFTELGGRKVLLRSTVDKSGFVPIPQVSATWIERGVLMEVTSQAVTKRQVERFFANLKEEPMPTKHESNA